MLKSIDLRQKVFLIILLCTFATEISALRGSSVVLQARASAKAAELAGTNVQNENNAAETDEDGGLGPTENSTKPVLTGIPQIDYVHDPNLPRELNGYNLSSYPFYNKVPTDISFKCDGLHDGFYASVPHKCQLYHHCLFGTRYDFLCANYTAFDQKTFICHFVSEVDCENSSKYFKRNEALYKAADSTTVAPPSTTTTTTTTTQAPTTYKDYSRERDRDRDYRDRDRDDFRDRMRDRDYRDRDRDRDYRDRVRDRPRDRDRDRDYRDRDYRDRVRERDRNRDSFSHRKRKPLKRRRPVYEYYYDDVYADEEYEDDLPPPIVKKSRKVVETVKPAKSSVEREFSSKRKSKLDDDRSSIVNSRKSASRSEEYDEEYYDDEEEVAPARASQGKLPQSGGGSPVQVKPASTISVFSRPRAPPKINRPVPLNEKSKYEYVKNT